MTADCEAQPVTELDVLDRFIHYANRIDQLMGARTRPAYAETCVCGASVEVGCELAARERTRLTNAFVSRHANCVRGSDIDLTGDDS